MDLLADLTNAVSEARKAYAESTSPVTQDEIDAELIRTVPVEALVDSVIQLTHQIHGCIERGGEDDARAVDLRAQRALAKAELVRRAGGAAR